MVNADYADRSITGTIAYAAKGIDLDRKINNHTEKAASPTNALKKSFVSFDDITIGIDDGSAENLIHAQTPVCREGSISTIRGPPNISNGWTCSRWGS
jgi:hypothetical protein